MDRPRRKHLDVLTSHISLAGLWAIDIGCGDGALVRALVKRGAVAIGVDPGLAVLRKARSLSSDQPSLIVAGCAEAVPLASGSVDIAIFFNSLHHVPITDQQAALAEAGRLLRPGGRVYVMEPLADGEYFALARLIDDETEVRAAAARAIADSVAAGQFWQETELFYDAPVVLPSYEAFRERVVDVAASRVEALDRHDAALRAAFEAHAEPFADGFRFWQPSRVNVLHPKAN